MQGIMSIVTLALPESDLNILVRQFLSLPDSSSHIAITTVDAFWTHITS